MRQSYIRKNIANLITFGRIVLCFGAFICACLVMVYPQGVYRPLLGFLGVWLLIATSATDYFDGLVARKLNIVSRIGPLADQVMDKMVYCIIFPTIAVGVMQKDGNIDHPLHMTHVIVVLVLCVSLLVRDHYINFLRTLVDRHKGDSSVGRIGKWRTLMALPAACMLYGYAFGGGGYEELMYLNAFVVWTQTIDIKYFYFLEFALLVINLASAIFYTRTYGKYFLEELCGDDEVFRHKFLSILPNALTLMNATMGITAVYFAWRGSFHTAFVLTMAAALFDKLDGAAARKLGLIDENPSEEHHFTLGMILDDVADFISFCMAPTLIALAYVPKDTPFRYLLWGYAFFGFCRLLYFTLDTKALKGFFKGLPTPAAALFAVGLTQACNQFDPFHNSNGPFWVLVGYSFLGLLMTSFFIHYVHFGRLMSESRTLTRIVLSLMLVVAFTPAIGLVSMVIMGLYLLSPLVTRIPTTPPPAKKA